jgi:methionyl-tRNA synthetase
MSASGRTDYLTTPIYYVNDVPHVGHAYTTIAADTLARAKRLMGRRVFFLTGTDEHGQNIERIAREKGIPEQEHCNRIAAVFKELWDRLYIRYDRFIRTTEEAHARGVLKLWSGLRSAKTPDGRDAVYKGKYAGLYCSRCEGFKDEEELAQPGNVCPDHERPCEWMEEENYFFRLSAYEGFLRDLIESGRLRIDPEARRNEVLAVIRQGLKDFSVSRARVKWGIPVPEQPDHVLYVWVDALSNYITGLGYGDGAPEYGVFWEHASERLHMLGKDIIRFHCLYWPALLEAAGVPTPTREFGQGFITKDGRKLSKTTGNVIDPDRLVRDFGPDAVRYVLLREGVYGQDWDFTNAAFVTRFNADLANDLGNLVSRALTMVRNYCDGRIPPAALPAGAEPAAADILARYDELDFSGALTAIWSNVSAANQAIVAFEPWVVAKDPARRRELEEFLYRLVERIRIVAVLASPVIPRAASRVLEMLGLRPGEPSGADLAWGRLVPGTPLGELTPLFPRIDKKDKKEIPVSDAKPVAPAAQPPAAPAEDRIDISEFARLDLRVAEIKAAERVPGSKKLVKMQVDLGTELRQVVAGIAEWYAPEALVGRKVALVANLKPAKLMGVESNGMVLAASPEGRAVLLSVEQDVPPGTKIK